jgi:hypothetical protein
MEPNRRAGIRGKSEISSLLVSQRHDSLVGLRRGSYLISVRRLELPNCIKLEMGLRILSWTSGHEQYVDGYFVAAVIIVRVGPVVDARALQTNELGQFQHVRQFVFVSLYRVRSATPKGIKIHSSDAGQKKFVRGVSWSRIRLPQFPKDATVAFEGHHEVITVPAPSVISLFWVLSSP